MGLRLSLPKVVHKYEIDGCPVLFVDNSEKVEKVLRMLKDSTRVGIDTEFAGCDINKEHLYGKAKMVSLQFSCAGPKLKGVHDAKYIFVPNWGEYTNTFRAFKKWMYDDKPVKVLHASKTDRHVMDNHGMAMRGLRSDTMAKGALWNISESHGLKEMAKKHLGYDTPDYRETFKFPRRLKAGGLSKSQMTLPNLEDIVARRYENRYREGGIRRLVEYAVKDPFYTVELDMKMDDKLGNLEWFRDKSMLDYYNTLDNPFLEALYKIERRGCLLFLEWLEEIREKMTEEVIDLEQEIFRQLVKKGISTRELETINIDSNTQLAKLFDQLGMELERTAPSSKFPNGQPSVSDGALSGIRSARFRPLINAVLARRSLADKMLGTYVEPWLALLKDQHTDNMLRTEYKFPGPKTGRLASAKPNLQNIPRPQENTGEGEGDKYQIRKAFIAPPGYDFADADLSQIELRLMAHFSGDPTMIKAFQEDWDLHARTAMFCFREVNEFAKGKTINKDLLKSIKANFPNQRQNAKTLGFMIAYGGGPKRYADVSGHSMQEGQRVIQDLFRGYPGLKRCIDKVKVQCRQRGYIRTLLGRYIHVPDINHHDKAFRAAAERGAFNYVIQGSAAELLKMTMILCDQCPKLADMDTTMRLQIHDELGFYTPKDKATQKKVKVLIDEYMSHPYRYFGMKDLKIPTPGDVAFGATWMDAKAA